MLKFIRNLIRPDEKKPLTLRFDEIPAWLESRRQEAGSLFEQATKKNREEIRAAAERLLQVIQILLAAQFNEEIHPKLKSIAQKSLPQYTKAIEAALEKPLPYEPEEFYEAAAELLRACINSAHGQGKYLRTVFPEEMKAVSACVAEIGRGINAMNAPLSAYRAKTDLIKKAEKFHAALSDIENDTGKAGEKEERMIRRIGETNDRIAGCERVFNELERERTGQDLSSREQAITLLKKERDLTVRRYAALSMTASHVLRKAEKVARRQLRQSDERAVTRAIAILSDHTVPDFAELVSALDEAYIPAGRMIDSGEVTLKNKEERSLFSSPAEFSREIRTLCSSYADLATRCDAAEQAYYTHPVIARHAGVARELQQLSDTCAKEKLAHAELVLWRSELVKNIPELREELKKAVGGISVSDVQIHYPDETPRAP